MAAIEQLVTNLKRFMSAKQSTNLAGAEKVWFAVYDKTEERRLRLRISEFENAAKQAGYSWKLLDVSDVFAEWFRGNEFMTTYFEQPDLLISTLEDFVSYCTLKIDHLLTADNSKDSTIVALIGVSSLFGFMKISLLIERVHANIQGRLLVFFPGEYENNNYRLMDARDGWNYLAVPITAHEGDLKW